MSSYHITCKCWASASMFPASDVLRGPAPWVEFAAWRRRRCMGATFSRQNLSIASKASDTDTASSINQNEQRVSNKRTRVLRQQRDAVLVDLSRSAPPSTVGVLGGQFSLSADRVAALQNEHGLSEDELLSMLITPASELARPRISSFHVGAAGIGASGAMYLGCNLEFARLPLYNSIHAEQFLLVNALHCGERGIRKVAVSAAPCGHCRQFYTELNCAETIKFSFSGGTYSLGQLLPMRFRPSDLLTDPNTPLLLDPQCNPLELTPDAKAKVSRLASTGDDAPLAIAAHAALEQARTSYAPYSRCPAGVAIVTEDGSVHGGGVIESAAFNPSLPPLQTAIIDAVLDGMPTYTTVRDVVLVELEGGHVQHAGATRAALEQIAPDARLTVFHVQWAEASKG